MEILFYIAKLTYIIFFLFEICLLLMEKCFALKILNLIKHISYV